MNKIREWVENPWLSLISGLVLLVTSGSEILETLESGSVGAHHGIAFLGLIQVIRSLPHILEGVAKMSQVSEGRD